MQSRVDHGETSRVVALVMREVHGRSLKLVYIYYFELNGNEAVWAEKTM